MQYLLEMNYYHRKIFAAEINNVEGKHGGV